MSDVRIEAWPAQQTKAIAAAYLSRSEREIDELRAAGKLIAVGDGKRVFFNIEELDRYRKSVPERDTPQ